MNDQQPKHVFISYVRENQKQVDRLCQDLEEQGVKVWLDRKNIKPGARWKDAIREAIRHGDFFIACFSDEYTSKGKTHMNEELVLATEELRQYPPDREWFIPVLLSECDVAARSIGAGETLLDINWVSLYEDWDAGIQRILSVIKPIPPNIQNLISALRTENRDVRKKAVEALYEIGGTMASSGLIVALNDKDENIRRYAAVVIADILGPEAKNVAPTLIEALKDQNEDKKIREGAALGLAHLSSEAKKVVPALIEATKDENTWIGIVAKQALMRIGPNATKTTVPILIEALKDQNLNVREGAVRTLSEIGVEAKAAVPDLIKTLDDEECTVRELAAEALGKIGSGAKSVVPVLIEAFKDWYPGTRKKAALSLGEIRYGTKTVVPILIEALKDEEQKVRQNAALALGKLGPKAKAAVSALIKTLKDKDNLVRLYAALALKNIHPEAKEAAPAIFEALKDKKVRQFTEDNLKNIALMVKTIVPDIIQIFREEYYAFIDIVGPVAKILAEVGPDVVPMLIESLKDDNKHVRFFVATTLAEFGPDAKPAVSALVKAFNQEHESNWGSYARSLIAFALGKIDPKAPAAKAILIKALKGRDADVSQSAMRALKEIGAEAKDFVPYLIKFLQYKGETLDLTIDILTNIDQEAVQNLILALKDRDYYVRLHAMLALGKIGPEAKAAVPALIELRKDDDYGVHSNATYALREINTPEAQKALEEYKQKSK